MGVDGFDYQHPVTGDLFVDRTDALEETLRRLEGGANLLIIAPRRMGKSSLIHEAFRRAPFDGTYVTCPHRGTAHDLAEAILDAVSFPLGRRLKDWFQQRVSTLRPVVTLQPDGSMRFSLDRVEPAKPVLEKTLQSLEDLAVKRGRRLVVAIDEIQRFLERDDGSGVSAMRDIIQFQQHVGYVFSGSKYHVLEQLLDAEGPFGHQLTPIHLGTIPIADFAALAKRRFKKAGGAISDGVLARIDALCLGNPKRTQEALFDLLPFGTPSVDDVDEVVRDQVERQHYLLEDLLDNITQGAPMDVLVALAEAPLEIAPYGQAFVRMAGLPGPQHVQGAIASLQKRGLIDQEHRFVDPYLRHHLRMRNPRLADWRP